MNQIPSQKCVPNYIQEDLDELNMQAEMEAWENEKKEHPKKEAEDTIYLPDKGQSKFVPDYVFEDLRATHMKEEMQSRDQSRKEKKGHSKESSISEK